MTTQGNLPMTMPVSAAEAGLGVIVPSANTILERDLPRLRLPGASFYFTRILNSEDTEEQLAGMKDHAAAAVELLMHTRKCRAIAFACTSGSFLKGLGYDREIVRLMEEAAGIPCVTTAGSVIAALEALGCRRPHVFTPYEEWLSQRSVTFLQAHGHSPAGHHWGFPFSRADATDAYEPIGDWVAANVSPDADCVFVSCTNFSWLRGIAPLEQRIGIPVVTSNSATLWGLLRAAGLDAVAPAGGRLLS